MNILLYFAISASLRFTNSAETFETCSASTNYVCVELWNCKCDKSPPFIVKEDKRKGKDMEGQKENI